MEPQKISGSSALGTSRSPDPLLMLIDGHPLMYRAWHAMNKGQHLIVTNTGEIVSAVYGFVNTFFKVTNHWHPTHCAIAFDLPTPSFRHNLYKEYKAHRPKTPQELQSQFGLVIELMKGFKIPIYQLVNYEADDILGALCRQAELQSLQTIVITGDTDNLQLVSPFVRVEMIQNSKLYDETGVEERYGGLKPYQIPDLKALTGDPSDNIHGVPGIGEKTAIRLLLEFGTIEGIYRNLDAISDSRIYAKLQPWEEQTFKGKELTTILRALPITIDLEASRLWQFDRTVVESELRKLDFHTLIARLPNLLQAYSPTDQTTGDLSLIHSHAAPNHEIEYVTVTELSQFELLEQELRKAKNIAFDTETTGTNPMLAELVGISLSTGPGKAWYIPVGNLGQQQMPMSDILAKLRPFFANSDWASTAHNANFDLSILQKYDFKVVNLEFDTKIAAHLLGRTVTGLKALALELLGQQMTPIEELIGTGRQRISMDQVPVHLVAPYACADADMTGRLRSLLLIELRQAGVWDLFSKIEMKLVPILVSMQRYGVALNTTLLRHISEVLSSDMAALKTELKSAASEDFNLNSPQQLSNMLFNQLGFPKTRRTKTGSFSTDASSLEDLRGIKDLSTEKIQFLDNILEYRQLAKLKSTYTDALPALVNPLTGRLHTRFNQTGVATGRISSSEPNLQNIPIRTERGREVRSSIIAEGAPGQLLLSADYSQIELRVLAHLSQDRGLLEAFQHGEDIHTATASMMFSTPSDKVLPSMRRIAKILNFGVIYGLSAYGISQQTDFTNEEGQRFIDTYFAKYPGIESYIAEIKDKARSSGFVETLLGRRRYIPDINSSNHNVRQAAERMAINMPVQGTAADILKIAMTRLHSCIETQVLGTKLLLQVHDELIFEVPEDELLIMKTLVLEEMPRALALSVPLRAEIKTGVNWGQMQS